MTTLTYPSDLFPGPPSVAIDIPAGWAPVRVGGTLLACRAVEAKGGFAANVVVRGYTRSVDYTIMTAVEELRQFVGEQHDGTVDPPFEVELGGVAFLGVNASWEDDEVGDLVQVHLFAGARRGALVDLVQVTGSVGGPEVQHDYDRVQGILQTVKVSR